jgi:hypothetical protein
MCSCKNNYGECIVSCECNYNIYKIVAQEVVNAIKQVAKLHFYVNVRVKKTSLSN